MSRGRNRDFDLFAESARRPLSRNGRVRGFQRMNVADPSRECLLGAIVVFAAWIAWLCPIFTDNVPFFFEHVNGGSRINFPNVTPYQIRDVNGTTEFLRRISNISRQDPAGRIKKSFSNRFSTVISASEGSPALKGLQG